MRIAIAYTRRMRLGAWAVWAVLGGTAYADPINLTASVPTTIATSSTVDNAAIKPEHIADGKLDTAWNSQTGDLTPHVMIRVPAGSRVTALKLTVGFTKVDKKLGDLFTMNPRIKKVRVTSGGKSADFDLDIANRGLQELAIAQLPAGDIDLAVLASEPGTKKTWREISISELEVWGTTTLATKAQRPAVRLRSLDAPVALTKAECAKVIGAIEGKVKATDQVGISAGTTICRIDADQGEGTTTVTLQAAAHKGPRALGSSIEITLENGAVTKPVSGDSYDATETVSLELVPLRTTEQALSVAEVRKASNEHVSQTTTKTTLYRVGAGGLVELISWESKYGSDAETNDGTECTGPTITPTAAMPKRLRVTCVEQKSDWWNDDPSARGTRETKTVTTYVWDGTSYVEK